MFRVEVGVAFVLAAATANAQSFCAEVPTPNAGFDATSAEPWVLATAGSLNNVVFTTDGVTASDCIEIRGATNGGTIRAQQPVAAPLVAGVEYELTLDAFSSPELGESSLSANLNFIFQGNGVASSLIAGLLQNGHRMVSARLVVPTTDDYVINLLVQSSNDLQATFRFDNLSIRRAAPLRISLPAERAAGTTNTVLLSGPPNSPVAALLSFQPTFGPGLAIPGCSGEFQLGAPLFVVGSLGTTNGGGTLTIPLFVPAAAAGVDLTWQAIGLAPCAFGCPIVLGLP